MSRPLIWSNDIAVGFRATRYCVEPCTDYDTGQPVLGWALTVNGQHLGTWLTRDAALSAAAAHNDEAIESAWSLWRQRALSSR